MPHLAQGGVARSLFGTTKLRCSRLALHHMGYRRGHNQTSTDPSLQDSLKKLRTDHLDLTLIHWPSPNSEVPVAEFMGALLKAKKLGLTKQVGVSNFTIALMKEAIAAVGAEHIATNQIELHPYLQNRKVVEFAQSQGIHITSYMTLAYGEVLKDPVIIAIADRHQATPAQVTLAWAMQLGYSVIPSSTKRTNLESNLKACSLKLSDEDMTQIAALDRGHRLTDPQSVAPAWD